MVEIVTWYTYKPSKGEINKEPSLTIDDGYEDLQTMVKRIIRGEIPAMRAQQVYDYGDESSVADDDFDAPVFDGLDDLTDVDVARDIMTSATSSAHSADTSVVAEDSKHGAEEVDKGAAYDEGAFKEKASEE